MFMGRVTHFGGSTRHISNSIYQWHIKWHSGVPGGVRCIIVSSEFILAKWNYRFYVRICKKFDSKLRK